MPNKILVTYASRLGSTAGVAEAIGKTLLESGAQVDVRRMEDVTDLAPYSAVVAGSAIRNVTPQPVAALSFPCAFGGNPEAAPAANLDARLKRSGTLAPTACSAV